MSANEVICKWKWENFSMLSARRGDYFLSPVFRDAEDTECQLKLFPRGTTDEESDGYVSMYFSSKASDETEVNVTLVVESIDSSFDASVSDTFKMEEGKECGYNRFISLKELNIKEHQYLPQDVLTIRFHLIRDHKNSSEKSVFKKAYTFRSGVQVQERSVTWPIPQDFNKGRIEKTLSEFFDDSPDLKLSLIVSETPDYFHYFIEIQQTGTTTLFENCGSLFVKCKITANNTSDKKSETSKEATHLFDCDPEDVWNFPLLIKTNRFSHDEYEQGVHRNLCLQFDFAFSYGSATYHWRTNYTPGSLGLKKKADAASEWLTSIRSMFESGEFSDVSLRAGGETFPSYKPLLCAGSPVFRSKFEIMTEKESRIVEIDDVDPATLERMLDYLHSGVLENYLSVGEASSLYLAADKYNIPLLKRKCSEWLASSLCVSNVWDVLVLADTHRDHFLMAAVRYFASNHAAEVFNSDHWDEVMNDDTCITLAAKFMHSILKK